MLHVICRFLSGVGIFLFAIVLLNSFLSQNEKKLPRKLETNLNKPFFCLTGGLILAAITQSSSAINSISVNLTEKKFLPRKSAYYLVIGTNIGTTVSGYIALFNKVSFTEIIVASIFFSALIMMLFKNVKVYNIGFLTSAVALVFCGLSIISRCIPDLILNFNLTLLNSQNEFMALLIGILVTAVFQSSALVTVIIVTLSSYGILNLNIAIFLIVGANVGTCATSMLASIGSKENGIKVALFSLIYNAIGMIIFSLLYPLGMLNWFLHMNVAQDTKIALFNTLFNVITMLFVIGFVEEIDSLLTRTKKSKVILQ
ncbi:Na/Pi cotransporter family protein [bacterium]|nr:Na/Pi cotransporter family protein [bacterium]